MRTLDSYSLADWLVQRQKKALDEHIQNSEQLARDAKHITISMISIVLLVALATIGFAATCHYVYRQAFPIPIGMCATKCHDAGVTIHNLKQYQQAHPPTKELQKLSIWILFPK